MGSILQILTLISITIMLSTQQQNKGVIFQHRGQLLYVADFHQTFVEIKLGGFLEELSRIDEDLRTLMHKSQEVSDNQAMQMTGVLRRQLANIHQKVLDLQITEELLDMRMDSKESLSSADKNIRKKRGLINGIGSVASYLFGLATSTEIEETNKKVGIIKGATNHVIEQLNKQVTVLKGLGTELLDVHKKVKLVQELVSQMKMRDIQHRLIENLLWIQGNINELSNRLNSVIMGLHRMKSGKIATEIIPLNTLKSILRRIKENDQHLLFNRSEQLALYTEMSMVVQVPAGEYKALRFVILLPLRDMAESFHLFELTPVPMWNSTLEMGIVYGPVAKYLAVSEDLTAFSPIQSLEDCTVNAENYVCPAGPPIYLQDHDICEVKLYLGSSHLIPTCPRTIYSVASPVFTWTKFGYSYSIPEPMEITVQCGGKPPTVRTVKASGIGKLTLQGGCHATGKGILLVSPNNEIQEGKDIIEFHPSNQPNISLFSDDEFKKLLYAKTLVDKHMERRAKTPIELNQLMNTLDHLQEIEFDKKWNTYSRPGSAIMAVILLIVVIIIVRLLCKRRKWVLRTIARGLKRREANVEAAKPHEGTSILANPMVEVQLGRELGATLNIKPEITTEDDGESLSQMTLRSMKQERSSGNRRSRVKVCSGDQLI